MGTKITQLPTRVAIQSDDVLVLANDAVDLNFKITVSDLAAQLVGDITMAVLKIELDEVSDEVFYVGEAIPGSLTSAAVWRIKRVTSSNISGSDLSVHWADNANFSQIWDNRLSLSYS